MVDIDLSICARLPSRVATRVPAGRLLYARARRPAAYQSVGFTASHIVPRFRGIAGGGACPFGVAPTCIFILRASDMARCPLMHDRRALSAFLQKMGSPALFPPFPFLVQASGFLRILFFTSPSGFLYSILSHFLGWGRIGGWVTYQIAPEICLETVQVHANS